MWRGEIVGSADGTVRFSMDGEAHTSFRRNRIGFCVLHPMQCAGRPVRITHVDGTQEDAAFPTLIAPQRFADGQIHPVYPFAEMQALAHEVSPGLWAEVRFEGDIFETEDQRNWTDASYKTYSTPLRLPFPAQVEAGTRIRQAITLRLLGTPPTTIAAGETAPAVTMMDAPPRPLPAVGLGMASHNDALTADEVAALQKLHLAHLRVDLDLATPLHVIRLARAVTEAKALGVPLEAALFVSDDAQTELAGLRALLDRLRPQVARWLVFHRAEKATSRRWVDLARAALSDYDRTALIGGGTNNFFTELNRQRPDPDALDCVCYSLSPQVHAFDNTSLMETPPAQAVTVASARTFAGDKPIVVGPVTLRPRGNPNATGPAADLPPDQLPPSVDVRQLSLLAAAWTLDSFKQLAQNGAAAVTYFETTGWRGVMERAAGSPLPARFPSQPGAVFPLYHVLGDIGEFAGGEVVPMTATRPLLADSVTLRQGDRQRTLVANLGPTTQTVTVDGLTPTVTVRLLDETTVEAAMLTPDAYRDAARTPVTTADGALTLTLLPYAVATIDAA